MTNNLLSKYRKHLLLCLFVAFSLSACGTSSNGVGGTGITQGRVTGFGSMFVNGVKFNTDNAIFIRDGVGSKKQEDFNTGEIVSIKGTVNSDRKTGTATEVIFSDVLEGTVTSTPKTNSIAILGQDVAINNLTVFHGFNKLRDLKTGNIVEVSGFKFKNKITASSIQLISTSFSSDSLLEIEGNISNLNSESLTFEINSLVIDFSNSQFSGIEESDIKNSDYLVVTSNQDVDNNVLIAANIKSTDNNLEANTYYEIEGFVTDFNSTANFTIDDENGITTNDNTIITNGSINDIKLDQLLIIIGMTDADGILLAEEIRLIDSSNTVSIEANIESIDQANNHLVVLGQTINVDSFTLISDETTEDFALFNLSEFTVGDSVFIDIYQSDGKIIANRLSKISTISSEFIIGTVDTIDTEQSQLSVFDNIISTNSITEFYDMDDNAVTSSTFFSLLESGITEVAITANYINTDEILAINITIINNE